LKILGIESSAAAAGAAVVENGKLLSEAYLNNGLTHSETLMPLVDCCLNNAGLKAQDIDAFAVSYGPGSFTGVRIGISAIKGICFGLEKPVYGISTLEALAYGAAVEDVVICPVMDARCMQVYNALFECKDNKLYRLCNDRALKLSELFEEIKKHDKKILLVGDGSEITKNYFIGQDFRFFCVYPEIFKFQHAAGVAFAAFMRYNSGEEGVGADLLNPAYLRMPQAERERLKKEKNK